MIQTICDAEAGGGGSWGPDGTILFAPTSASALYRVSASGGQPVAVTKLDASRHETYHRYPFFLPDGRHFLYMARGTTTAPRYDPSSLARRKGRQGGRANRPPMPPTQRDICSTRGRARCQPGRSISAGSKRQETQFRSLQACRCTSGITFSSARRSACSCSPAVRLRHAYDVALDRSIGQAGSCARRAGLLWLPASFAGWPQGGRGRTTIRPGTPWTSGSTMPPRAWGPSSSSARRSGTRVPSGLPRATASPSFHTAGAAARPLFVKPINGASKEVLLESADEYSPEDWSPDGRFVSLLRSRIKAGETVSSGS